MTRARPAATRTEIAVNVVPEEGEDHQQSRPEGRRWEGDRSSLKWSTIKRNSIDFRYGWFTLPSRRNSSNPDNNSTAPIATEARTQQQQPPWTSRQSLYLHTGEAPTESAVAADATMTIDLGVGEGETTPWSRVEDTRPSQSMDSATPPTLQV